MFELITKAKSSEFFLPFHCNFEASLLKHLLINFLKIKVQIIRDLGEKEKQASKKSKSSSGKIPLSGINLIFFF